MFFNKALIEENKRLKAQIHNFETAVESMRDEMAYIELDNSGDIKKVNKNALSILGYSEEELLNKKLTSFICDSVVSREHIQKFIRSIDRSQHWHGALQLTAKDKSESWLRTIVQPFTHNRTQKVHFALFANELTRTIAQSREHNDMLSALERSTAVIEFDLEGNILKANDNFLATMKYSEGDIIGHHHRMFCSSEVSSSKEYIEFWNSLRKGTIISDRFVRLDSGGNEVWLEASYNPIYNEKGILYKVVKFATNITEQMNQEKAISEAANIAFSISKNMGEYATQGRDVVNENLTTMNLLSEQIGTASQGIKDLDEQSQKVAELVQSISGIADQTNLLALNAAIEAARAGDQGRGFAVVADEVRQLASRISKATEEIVDVVSENRKLTENAVQQIEAGQEQASQALGYSKESGQVINQIQKGSEEVVEAIGQFTRKL